MLHIKVGTRDFFKAIIPVGLVAVDMLCNKTFAGASLPCNQNRFVVIYQTREISDRFVVVFTFMAILLRTSSQHLIPFEYLVQFMQAAILYFIDFLRPNLQA